MYCLLDVLWGNPILRLPLSKLFVLPVQVASLQLKDALLAYLHFLPFECLSPGVCHVTQVQRQLQLRIEAQGKYLQTILEKAKEALGSHIGASPGLEAAHAELTELASKVNSEPMNMSFPPLALPELPTHSADTRIANLPRQQSRVSDSSSQKSYVTQVTANPEDSGGASASCENQASTGVILLNKYRDCIETYPYHYSIMASLLM
jgi:hypothetical protein